MSSDYSRDDSPKRKKEPKEDAGHVDLRRGDRFFNGRFLVKEVIGKGTFGLVLRCEDTVEREEIAVKVIRPVARYSEAAEIEVDILKSVRTFGGSDRGCCELLYHFKWKNSMCLGFPVYGLSLYDFMKNNHYAGDRMDDLQFMTVSIFRSIEFLHNNCRLIHTDLKPENILFKDIRYYEEGRVRRPRHRSTVLIDFGSATFEKEHHSSIISTRQYRAPEVVLNSGWSFPADMWSLGCILYELWTGNLFFPTHGNHSHLLMMEQRLGPFPAELLAGNEHYRNNRLMPMDDAVEMKKIADLDPLDSIAAVQSSEREKLFVELLGSLLAYHPDRRLTATQAWNHPFLRVID